MTSAAPRALLLSGSIGMGHDVMAEACADSLQRRNWQTRVLDSVRMMGRRKGGLAEAVFRGMLAVPGAYDAFHFSQLRTGGRLARRADAASCRFLVPALRAELARRPVELLVAVFATGAGAAARVKQDCPGLVTAVFCTDSCPHYLWVHDSTDLYLVTSATAERYVRRFQPRAQVEVVPTPVRAAFYDPPTRQEARRRLGVPEDARCALLMSGSWGVGPLGEAAQALASAGVHVLAVAGRNRSLAAALRRAAVTEPRIIPFGFTQQVPVLMASADLVVTSSGDTCSEARVIGRDLLLLDVVPGHGRDNLQEELARGRADVTSAEPAALVESALACLDRAAPPPVRVAQTPDAWEDAVGKALARVGLG